jgi:hypothetical protein
MLQEAQASSRSAAAVFTVVLAAMVAVVLFLLGAAYLSSGSAFNSDHLYPSAVCEDFRQGRNLAGWYLPGAPYLFPDMALMLPCQVLTGNLALQFLGYVFALFVCLLAAVFWLGRSVGLSWRQAFAAAASGLLLLVTAHLGKAYEGRGTHLASPGSHFGIVPVGIAMLALAVGLLRRGPRPLPVVLFLAFGAFGAFSDKLLLVQFLAPLSAALVLLACCRIVTVRQVGGMLGLVGGAVLLAAELRVVFARLGFHLLQIENTFGFVKLRDLPPLLAQVREEIAGQHLLAALMPLYLLAAVLVVAARLRRRDDETVGPASPDRAGVLVAVLTLALAPACNLAAVFAAGLSGNSAVPRYLLPCYVLPLLLTGWFLALLPGRAGRPVRLVFPVLVVLFAGWRVIDRGPELAAVQWEPPYPPLAQVLDRLVRERGPLRGMGEFWSSRQMHFLTRERVIVNPLDRYGLPFFHASDRKRFLADDPHDTSVPRCDFIVVRPGCSFRDPGPEMIALLYGLPRERVPAGEHEVWLYDRLRSSPLDRFFRARIAERLRARNPGTAPSSPACLAQPKANMSPTEASGNVPIAPGESLEVRFARPVCGKSIDVAAGHDELFDLEFHCGERRLGRLHVPGVPVTGAAYEYPGIQARLLALPPALQTEEWDRVVVRPRAGSGTVHLGHLFVRPDDVPDTGVGPSQRMPRVRLEAEWLQTFTTFRDDFLAASTPDPRASGGRVREAAADFRGPVSFTSSMSLPAGRYRLDYAMRVADTAVEGEIADIDALCFAPKAVLAARSLHGSDFPAADRFTAHSLTIDLAEDTDFLFFRFASRGKTAVALDYIDLIALPAGASPKPGVPATGSPPHDRAPVAGAPGL